MRHIYVDSVIKLQVYVFVPLHAHFSRFVVVRISFVPSCCVLNTSEPNNLKQTAPKHADILASYSHEKELERAKWYKEDLDEGGWREVSRGPGYVSLIKTFPEEECPIKVLGSVEIPLSAEMYVEVLNQETRRNEIDGTKRFWVMKFWKRIRTIKVL